MDPMLLIDRYLEGPERTLQGLAEAAGIASRYLCEVRSGKHRMSPAAATGIARVLQAAGVLETGEIALLRFQLACRNLDLSAVRARVAVP